MYIDQWKGPFLFPAATYTSISWLLPGIVGGQARACDHVDQRGGSESRHLCRHFSATTSPTYHSRCEGFLDISVKAVNEHGGRVI